MFVGTNLFSRLDSLTRQTSRISDELAEVSLMATTGLAINSPSDSPEQVERIADLTTAITDQQQYTESSDTATNLLSSVDSSLSDLAEVLGAAHQLAVQMSSETYDGIYRTSSASLADGFLDQALALVNTSISGRSLFAGTAYDGDAFDTTTLAYLGSTDESTIDVGDQASVTVGFDGDALGLSAALTAISDLSTALSANDVAGVQTAMTDLESAIDAVSKAQTVAGGEQAIAMDFASLSESMELELVTQLSSVQDADAIESLVRLSELQTLYETALNVTAGSNMGSLFDRI
jgi:flagellar hook-associated protein 3 FlgL